MLVKLNINQIVKVKLTKTGVDELKRQHDELPESLKFEFNLKVDEDGYSSFQCWQLMSTFGHMMTLGLNLPFETEILLDAEPEQQSYTIKAVEFANGYIFKRRTINCYVSLMDGKWVINRTGFNYDPSTIYMSETQANKFKKWLEENKSC